MNCVVILVPLSLCAASAFVVTALMISSAFRLRGLVRPVASLCGRKFSTAKIIYTETDEAPALATYSLLPIVKKFAGMAGITVESSDISLSGRIIANFADKLRPEQRQRDELSELGVLCTKPEANIIKLPNVSASVPQLNAAISELRQKGYDIPLYPQDPKTDEDKAIRDRFSKMLGTGRGSVSGPGISNGAVRTSTSLFSNHSSS